LGAKATRRRGETPRSILKILRVNPASHNKLLEIIFETNSYSLIFLRETEVW
jgi:hypothetical protein